MKHVLIVLSIHSWKRQCRANEWHMTLLKQIVIKNYILDKHFWPVSQFLSLADKATVKIDLQGQDIARKCVLHNVHICKLCTYKDCQGF